MLDKLLTILSLIILFSPAIGAGFFWGFSYEKAHMQQKIDRVLAERERELRRWSEVAKDMDHLTMNNDMATIQTICSCKSPCISAKDDHGYAVFTPLAKDCTVENKNNTKE